MADKDTGRGFFTAEVTDTGSKVAKQAKPAQGTKVGPEYNGPRLGGESLLDEVDHEALRAEAAKSVEEDFKKAERQKTLKKYIAEERTKYDPEEEQMSILIDLPGHSQRVVINGREFYHGTTYTVPMSLYRSLDDIQYCAWKHEDAVGGANRDSYVKPRHITLRPGSESMAPQQLMRV